ncbi:MAG: hypothetical protein LBM19_02570 [Holosporales bacterium]|jgi:hypothetical protein|nr:hypothetical protein [Holosporales bacterium]
MDNGDANLNYRAAAQFRDIDDGLGDITKRFAFAVNVSSKPSLIDSRVRLEVDYEPSPIALGRELRRQRRALKLLTLAKQPTSSKTPFLPDGEYYMQAVAYAKGRRCRRRKSYTF